jgi:hypothetical protein
MPDEVQVDPGLARRIDFFAVTMPRANQRTIWISGVLGLWSLVGCVFAAVARHGVIAAILFVTVLLTGLMFWVSLRAKRRMPATKRWIDEMSAR